MGQHSGGARTFFGRLAADRRGNTLAIAAAALLPMMALIGGGVDVSRAYMAKTQLQSACDAGVLAGRKALSKSGEYGDSEKAKADKMFDFNFDAKSLDVEDVTYSTDDNDDGQVLGTASATMPTLVMKIFKKNDIDLTVNCMAELQIGNADIMFVLDTTGSMAQSISYGDPAKIDGLRSAVEDFHKTINQAVNDNRTRIRYGFVPYSMTVNAKGLIRDSGMPTDYFSDEHRYQTRLARFHTPVNVVDNVEDLGYTYETYSSQISSSNCNKYGNNTYPSSNGANPVKTGTAPNPVTSKEYDFYSWTRAKSGNNGTCVRRIWTTRTNYDVEYQFTNWIYQEAPVDTSTFKTGVATTYVSSSGITSTSDPTTSSRTEEDGAWDPVALAKKVANGTAHSVGTTTSTWNGCIEERNSEEPDTTYDFDPVSDEAYDLNLSLAPDNDDTAWKPKWDAMELTRSNQVSNSYYLKPDGNGRYYTSSSYSTQASLPGTPSTACPSEMMLFRTVTLSDNANDVPSWLHTYLNNLVATGNTYHDVGMIWGGRLTNPNGIFASNVNLDADKISVSKHIVFMTDGIMEPTPSGYSAYGIENLDHRIAPLGYEGTITARHNARFAAMCDAVKAQGVTIWVVAFGTSMTTELQNCASDGRAYYSSNTTALRNTFKFIAAQVADLRLGA